MKRELADRLADLGRALDNLSARLRSDREFSEDAQVGQVLRSLDLKPAEVTATHLANLRKWGAGFYDDMEAILGESAIQCFEICYELFEKSLRQFLQEVLRVSRAPERRV